jgi:hypothetical protein
MLSIRHVVPLICAAALMACADAAGPVGPPPPSASLSLPELETEFLPGIPVLDPFAEQLDGPGVTESARGGGHITFPDGRRTFAFTAKTKSDGTTQGQFQLNNREEFGGKEHGVVTCLEVQGNGAWVGGVVTHSDGTTKGLVRVWRVIDNGEGWGSDDNGEGSSSGGDMITRAFPGDDQTCRTLLPPPGPFLHQVTDGNIQVTDGGPGGIP